MANPFDTILTEGLQFLTKGLEITQLIEEEKDKIYLVIDFLRQKQQLEEIAKQGRLKSADLEVLKQVEDILKKYLASLEKIKNLNQNNRQE